MELTMIFCTIRLTFSLLIICSLAQIAFASQLIDGKVDTKLVPSPVEYAVLLPEFLHRLLWDHKISHEYHLVRGADHVGRTIRPRAMEALAFLTRVLNPPPPDPEAEATRKRLEPLKKLAEGKP